MHTFLDGRIIVKTGDITDESADAVVNAANSTLMGGGGVDGAIHIKGGPQILEECRKIRESVYPDGLPVGKAVVTSGGNLHADWVIHTVGPVWRGGTKNEEKLLSDCYRNSLSEAEKLDITRISFPAISTGVYGFPKERAAGIAFNTVSERLKHNSLKVTFVFFSEQDMNIFLDTVKTEKYRV